MKDTTEKLNTLQVTVIFQTPFESAQFFSCSLSYFPFFVILAMFHRVIFPSHFHITIFIIISASTPCPRCIFPRIRIFSLFFREFFRCIRASHLVLRFIVLYSGLSKSLDADLSISVPLSLLWYDYSMHIRCCAHSAVFIDLSPLHFFSTLI